MVSGTFGSLTILADGIWTAIRLFSGTYACIRGLSTYPTILLPPSQECIPTRVFAQERRHRTAHESERTMTNVV